MEQISPSLEKASHRSRIVTSFGNREIRTPTVSHLFQGSQRIGAEGDVGVGVRPVEPEPDEVDILDDVVIRREEDG
jgi:hypothetical protein